MTNTLIREDSPETNHGVARNLEGPEACQNVLQQQ